LEPKVCCLTGGPFLKRLEKFLDLYYEGKVVMGRLSGSPPIDWEDFGAYGCYNPFLAKHRHVVHDDPFTLFKETRPVKRRAE